MCDFYISGVHAFERLRCAAVPRYIAAVRRSDLTSETPPNSPSQTQLGEVYKEAVEHVGTHEKIVWTAYTDVQT